MVTVGGGNTRTIRGKDMEHTIVLMDADTLGNSVIISITGMEYSDGLMEKYITENTKRVRKMVKDITGGMMKNIGESTKMT